MNGATIRLLVEGRATLLDVLREQLGLTGSKMGCNHGQCGACTVHVDGRRGLGCLTPAASLRGKRVRTIDGIAAATRSTHATGLHRV